MVELVSLENLEINNLNDIQHAIIRIIISKKDIFNYEEIEKDIKTYLINKGVSRDITESFKINNMIIDTLDILQKQDKLNNINNRFRNVQTERKINMHFGTVDIDSNKGLAKVKKIDRKKRS